MTDADRERLLESNRVLADEALRVLALAYRDVRDTEEDSETAGHDLVFVAMVGMIDPLRDEAADAIAKCRAAGIRVTMLTGDQPHTATAIARQLGIAADGETINARELGEAGSDGWRAALDRGTVFARVSPEHKLRIVEGLQQRGDVVAMTGDGVNDAPALKQADIGIAMGGTGTDVAKETSDMIVTDDNFTSIVGAVEQGRIIYRSIQRFIHYLFSCNLSEILTVFIALIVGWPVPLLPLQILWLNMVTDVFPALAVALEPAGPGVMTRPPRDPRQRILDASFARLISWQALVLAAVTLVAFVIGLRRYGAHDPAMARTMAFMTLALAQTFHVFNTRSREHSMFGARMFANRWLWSAVVACVALQVVAVGVPGLRHVLGTTALAPGDWVVIVVCSLAPLAVVEGLKGIRAAHRANSPAPQITPRG